MLLMVQYFCHSSFGRSLSKDFAEKRFKALLRPNQMSVQHTISPRETLSLRSYFCALCAGVLESEIPRIVFSCKQLWENALVFSRQMFQIIPPLSGENVGIFLSDPLPLPLAQQVDVVFAEARLVRSSLMRVEYFIPELKLFRGQKSRQIHLLLHPNTCSR